MSINRYTIVTINGEWQVRGDPHGEWVRIENALSLEAEVERLTAERDEARARAEGLAEALTRVLMWAPRSTEAACEQDYEVARAALAALPAPPEEADDSDSYDRQEAEVWASGHWDDES